MPYPVSSHPHLAYYNYFTRDEYRMVLEHSQDITHSNIMKYFSISELNIFKVRRGEVFYALLISTLLTFSNLPAGVLPDYLDLALTQTKILVSNTINITPYLDLYNSRVDIDQCKIILRQWKHAKVLVSFKNRYHANTIDADTSSVDQWTNEILVNTSSFLETNERQVLLVRDFELILH